MIKPDLQVIRERCPHHPAYRAEDGEPEPELTPLKYNDGEFTREIEEVECGICWQIFAKHLQDVIESNDNYQFTHSNKKLTELNKHLQGELADLNEEFNKLQRDYHNNNEMGAKWNKRAMVAEKELAKVKADCEMGVAADYAHEMQLKMQLAASEQSSAALRLLLGGCRRDLKKAQADLKTTEEVRDKYYAEYMLTQDDAERLDCLESLLTDMKILLEMDNTAQAIDKAREDE